MLKTMFAIIVIALLIGVGYNHLVTVVIPENERLINENKAYCNRLMGELDADSFYLTYKGCSICWHEEKPIYEIGERNYTEGYTTEKTCEYYRNVD